MTAPPTDSLEAAARRRHIGILLLFGLATLAGLWLLGVIAADLWAYRAASAWPTTSGEIVDTGVQLLPGAADGDDAYGVVIRYRYVVDGVAYESSRLRREGNESFTTRAAATEVLSTYLRHGRESVVVHYNPADPQTAVLNISPPTYLLLFVVFYWVTLVGFALSALRQARIRRPLPTDH